MITTVFTNGCFDVLHRGHLELLKYCRTLGTRVIVGLNSDESVKKNKGKSRPIFGEKDRKFFLESLVFVDEVIIFNEETPYLLIKKLNPDVIVKGSDHNVSNIVGNDISEVKIFKYVENYSTTKIIHDIIDR